MEYVYNRAVPSLKAVLKRMLLRGSGIRDCAVVLNISTGVVLRTITAKGFSVEIKPQCRHYHKVHIDEQWSYVQNKDKKVWLLYAIYAESGEILAASWGKRSRKTVRMMLMKLKQLEIDLYCTDECVSFKEVLSAAKHIVGKEHTKRIEGINTWFRVRLRRLCEENNVFLQKAKYHYAMMKWAIVQRNLRASYI